MTQISFTTFLATICIASVCAANPNQALWPKVPATVTKPLPNDLFNATVHRLENGLTVYLSPSHQEPRISAWIAVRAGSKHDPHDSTGMAHYLEHMLLKGSESFGTLNYEKEKPHLDRILALYEKLFDEKEPVERKKIFTEIDQENIKASQYAIPNELAGSYRQMGFENFTAFTYYEGVTYICHFPSNRAEAWAKVESERFAHPVFRLFQNEIEIVYEEKNKYMDYPSRVISKAKLRQLFKKHPYGQQTTLGSIEHLKNPSLRKMYEFYDKYYVPNNMAIALAGDFQREPMLALIKEYFGAWKPKPLPEPRSWDLSKPSGVERIEVKYQAEEQVVMAWMLPHNRHSDADALYVMSRLMGNRVTGIITLSLNQAQKVKRANASNILMNDAGYFYINAVPKKGQTLEEAEKLLLGCLDQLKAGEFTDEDMRAIIANYEVREKKKAESHWSRVSVMAFSFQQFREWKENVNRIDRLHRVTRNDVLRVARKYLDDNYVVAYRHNAKTDIPKIKKPEFTKIDIDPSRQSEFFREILDTRVQPIRPRWLKQGRDFTVTEHPWGALYAGSNPVNELFSIQLTFYFGEMHDRKLSTALNLLRLSGAGELSAEEFKKKLYSLGTSLKYGSDDRWVYVNVDGLDKNLDPSLELVFRHFDSPNVAAGILDKMIQVEIGVHQNNKQNPSLIHSALGQYAQHGQNSHLLAGLNDEQLQALKTGELVSLARRVLDFTRNVVYVGNRSLAEVVRLLDNGRETYKSPPPNKVVRYVKPERTRVLFMHRDMVQSQVGIYAVDEIFNPKHHVDYEYITNYIGGNLSGLIFQEIREARGLAYHPNGGYFGGHWKGDENIYKGWLNCQADKTIEAVTLLQDLLRNPTMSEKRFAETVKIVEEGYRTKRLGFREIPSQLIRWIEQGMTRGDPRPGWFKKARKYRMSDLKSFVERFRERPMTIYILGNRERVDMDKLKQIGDFKEVSIDEIFPY